MEKKVNKEWTAKVIIDVEHNYGESKGFKGLFTKERVREVIYD